MAEGWLERFEEIMEAYQNESDRAAAVLAASFFDSILEQKLCEFLVDENDTAKLFESYGPLGSFAARVDVAFALGLMNRRMKHDLKIIRRIRNLFSHHPESIDFETPAVKDRCRQLVSSRVAKSYVEAGKSGLNPNDGRMQYILSIAMCLSLLENLTHTQQRRIVPPEDVSLDGKVRFLC